VLECFYLSCHLHFIFDKKNKKIIYGHLETLSEPWEGKKKWCDRFYMLVW